MTQRVERLALFTLYQTTIAVGILLMPIALLARQAGVTLPIHRFVERSGAAYRARAR